MSCSVCAGYSSTACPCCSVETERFETPAQLFKFDVVDRVEVECSEEEYRLLPVDEDDALNKGARYCQ